MSKHTVVIRVELGAKCTFTITDGNGNPGNIELSYRSDQDDFVWYSKSGALSVVFPNGNPFDPSTPPPYSAKRGECTAPVAIDPNAALNTYKYDVIVTPQNGASCRYDPQVIVLDDTLIIGKRES